MTVGTKSITASTVCVPFSVTFCPMDAVVDPLMMYTGVLVTLPLIVVSASSHPIPVGW